MDNYLFPNRRCLAENYSNITEWAWQNNIAYFPGVDVAFFLWGDFERAFTDRYLGLDSVDAERAVNSGILHP